VEPSGPSWVRATIEGEQRRQRNELADEVLSVNFDKIDRLRVNNSVRLMDEQWPLGQ